MPKNLHLGGLHKVASAFRRIPHRHSTKGSLETNPLEQLPQATLAILYTQHHVSISYNKPREGFPKYHLTGVRIYYAATHEARHYIIAIATFWVFFLGQVGSLRAEVSHFFCCTRVEGSAVHRLRIGHDCHA